MKFDGLRPSSAARLWLARGIAVAADLVQIAVFPAVVEGALSPLNDALDVGVALVLTLLVGWHIAFLPSFVVKLLPVADLAPTWTIAVLVATTGRRRVSSSPSNLLPQGDENANPWRAWYDSLAKPGWTPSPRTIALIWTVLYPVLFLNFGFVFVQAARGRLPWRVALPFGINLAANLLFTPILLRLRKLGLATADILLVLTTGVWAMVAIWPHHRLVAVAQVPYLLWGAVATVLQVNITLRNRR